MPQILAPLKKGSHDKAIVRFPLNRHLAMTPVYDIVSDTYTVHYKNFQEERAEKVSDNPLIYEVPINLPNLHNLKNQHIEIEYSSPFFPEKLEKYSGILEEINEDDITISNGIVGSAVDEFGTNMPEQFNVSKTTIKSIHNPK